MIDVELQPIFDDVLRRNAGEAEFLGLAVWDGAENAEELVAETGVTYPTAQDKDGSVIAALAMPHDRERCLEAGMDEYMSKPVNLKAHVKIIQSFLFERVSRIR